MRAWFEMLKEFGEALAALGFSVSARKTVLHSLCNAYHLAVSWSTPSNWSIPQWSQEVQLIVCAAAWQAITDYDPVGQIALGALVYQRARSAARVRLTQEWRYCSHSARLSCGASSSDGSTPEPEAEPQSLAPGPPELATAQEVRVAVEAMPDRYATLLIKVDLQGFTEAELAENLHLSQVAISKRRRRGLQKLRKYLKP